MKLLCLFTLFCGGLSANENSTTLKDLQMVQHEFDEQYWQINAGFEKIRHIFLHLIKTTGKMALYCDIKEHGKIEPDPSQLINEVLPDLLIHALQIANYYEVDLGEKFAERTQFNIEKSQKKWKEEKCADTIIMESPLMKNDLMNAM